MPPPIAVTPALPLPPTILGGTALLAEPPAASDIPVPLLAADGPDGPEGRLGMLRRTGAGGREFMLPEDVPLSVYVVELLVPVCAMALLASSKAARTAVDLVMRVLLAMTGANRRYPSSIRAGWAPPRGKADRARVGRGRPSAPCRHCCVFLAWPGGMQPLSFLANPGGQSPRLPIEEVLLSVADCELLALPESWRRLRCIRSLVEPVAAPVVPVVPLVPVLPGVPR